MPPQTKDPISLTMGHSEPRSFRVYPTAASRIFTSLRNFDEVIHATELTSEESRVDNAINKELGRLFKDLCKRFCEVEVRLEVSMDENSPVLDACRLSLQKSLRESLNQIAYGIESLDDRKSERSNESKKFQVTLAILQANQHLDMVALAISGADVLDREFSFVLEAFKRQSVPKQLKSNLCVSVSSWSSSALVFDLSVGELASTVVDGIGIDLEPVLEVKADDILLGKTVRKGIRVCNLDIERTSYRAIEFAAGLGTVGEASVRVRLALMDDLQEKIAETWGSGSEVEKICIKEARTIQLNAYPPKPRANVDLYTSYSYGDSSVTITLVTKTFQTKNGEKPMIHVQLVLSPSLSL